ncbi:hypothetical protein [Cryobacterium fucosi]|uniref:Uncharacterized protein n=1 Tax=Cryobacterium fucosi TaxID=1259157 RepID=A0A4R9B837_9MICO|nr:hypothetical protein [Cryobacterium fucosi]TFD78007.1 hypothetical protein E3T48_07950 [Cryobacterium fucosi]
MGDRTASVAQAGRRLCPPAADGIRCPVSPARTDLTPAVRTCAQVVSNSTEILLEPIVFRAERPIFGKISVEFDGRDAREPQR